MSKVIELGTVTKVHSSGVCETDKKVTVTGDFKVGTKLVMDSKSRKVSAKAPKTKEDKASENNEAE